MPYTAFFFFHYPKVVVQFHNHYSRNIKIAWDLKTIKTLCWLVSSCVDASKPEAEVPRTLKEAWETTYTHAPVPRMGCSQLETEHLLEVASRAQVPANCGQLKKHLQTQSEAQRFILFNTMWVNQTYGGTHPAMGRSSLIERRVTDTHKAEGYKRDIKEEYSCSKNMNLFFKKTFSILSLY